MDRRYYIMMGTIAVIFCLGALFFGVDAQSVARRASIRQKQETAAIDAQLRDNPAPKTADDVVAAGY
jgi:hypothetical protein